MNKREFELQKLIVTEQTRTALIERIGKIVCEMISWGGRGTLAYLAYLSVEALAGKETFAQILVDVGLGEKFAMSTLVVTATASLLYARYERHLRKTTVERLHKRIRALEERLDPTRESSELTPRGDTNPRDII